MDAFWIVVSALNFVLLVAVVYGVIRLARWFTVGRRHAAADMADLRERVAQIEAARLRERSN